MQLRDMQFAKIAGTEVTVKVNSAVEAKSAIKELRHKKKEVGLLKRRVAAELKRARAAEAKAERVASRTRRQSGFFAALGRLSSAFSSDDHSGDVERLEKDLVHTEEILHNIESCIIQLEGKLLS
jgi:hypothetical protein